MAISSAQEIIDDIRQGKMVILMDDEDRENEGDLILAAEKITPEIVNFMATHGRGLICLTLSKERCNHLGLPLMVQNNNAQFSTAFTLSIEAAKGVTTGISAADRACTILAAVNKNAVAADIVQPGHIFPLMAKDGGVLVRPGHTEAGCDLARLAGFEPASVIVEILNEDGTMARRPDLEKFGEKHGIKLGTIADLIDFRRQSETLVEQIACCILPTEYGEFELVTYRDLITHDLHYALCKGEITLEPTLVHLHIQNSFQDLLNVKPENALDCSLNQAMQEIQQQGGVLLVMAKDETANAVLNKIQALATHSFDNKEEDLAHQISLGAQILADLGAKKLRFLTNKNKELSAFAGRGLEIVD